MAGTLSNALIVTERERETKMEDTIAMMLLKEKEKSEGNIGEKYKKALDEILQLRASLDEKNQELQRIGKYLAKQESKIQYVSTILAKYANTKNWVKLCCNQWSWKGKFGPEVASKALESIKDA